MFVILLILSVIVFGAFAGILSSRMTKSKEDTIINIILCIIAIFAILALIYID